MMFGNVTKPLFGSQQTQAFGVSSQSPFSLCTTSTSSTLGFGAKPTVPTAFNLGSAPAKTTGSLFGGVGTAASYASPFSFSATSKSSSLFGSTLGAPAAVTSKPTSLFSFQPARNVQAPTGLQLGSAFGQNTNQQQTQQQQQIQQSVDAFYASLSQPMIFGDQRDSVIAKLNQLQSMLGMGIGFSALGPVNYTPDNPFSLFRGIAYNVMPTSTEADGLVCMELSKPHAEVMPQKQALHDLIFRLLGMRANCQLVVEEIRPSARSENNTEVVIKVLERHASGATHVVPATDLANFLCSPAVKSQLESQLFVCRLMPELAPTASQINAYLELPPVGFDKRVWQQAKENNPAPNRLIPVPVVGLADLRRRREGQLIFGNEQRKSVKHLLTVASNLQTHQLATSQKIAEVKRKQIELNLRILKLLAKQTVSRRSGFAISAEEEALRCALEHVFAELTGPRGLRTRINQHLLPALRAEPHQGVFDPSVAGGAASEEEAEGSAAWWKHPAIVDDLREYLRQRTAGIQDMRRLLTELSAVVAVLAEKKKRKVADAASVAMGLSSYSPFGTKVEPAF